jgi:hypothetical protein
MTRGGSSTFRVSLMGFGWSYEGGSTTYCSSVFSSDLVDEHFILKDSGQLPSFYGESFPSRYNFGVEHERDVAESRLYKKAKKTAEQYARDVQENRNCWQVRGRIEIEDQTGFHEE